MDMDIKFRDFPEIAQGIKHPGRTLFTTDFT